MKKNIYIFLILIFSNKIFAQVDTLAIENLKVDVLSIMQRTNDSEKNYKYIVKPSQGKRQEHHITNIIV